MNDNLAHVLYVCGQQPLQGATQVKSGVGWLGMLMLHETHTISTKTDAS